MTNDFKPAKAGGNQPRLSKEEYAEKKRAEKEKVYQMIDDAAREIVSDPEKFKSFLDTQSRMDRYSAANALLIYSQYPQATQLKDFDDWGKDNVKITKGAKSISILEPVEYTRADGSPGISYNVKKVFDVTQTNGRKAPAVSANRDPKALITTMLDVSPVEVAATDELPYPNMAAFYNNEKQAAEGSFNTKYPHEPNGIKDPEYSIQCGVQELKAALTSAEVESPIDMEHIKLALQGYNFGNGYISWAKTNYGGYSYANAVEFSTQQAQRLGWDSYGDTQYPAHVLRYYPYGRAFTAGGNQAIVEVALTQLGNQGGQPYWSWYGFNSRVEWCACFVSWCADQCGYIESGLVPKFAGCVDGANWFKSNGKWQDRTYEPKTGDIIFFDWEGDGTTDHVGIVEKCENGTVYTVEGNSGDACKQRQYAVGSSNIYGYGIPAY